MRRRLTLAVLATAAALAAAGPALADVGTRADEVRVFDWVRTFWPIIIVFGGMVVAGVMAGLTMRFVTSARFDLLREKVDRIDNDCQRREARVTALEEANKSSPTRSELQEDIAELSSRMRGVEVGLTGIDGRLETTNTYLHTLLERGLLRGAA